LRICVLTNTNSNSTITINTTDTLDLDIDHYYGHTIDVSSMTTSTIDTGDLFLSDINDFEISITEPKDFITHMPDLHEIETMCKYYPALEKAYENFKTIYNMVRQDYVGNHKSNEAPF